MSLDSLAHKYNAGPLKSFALAMISRNVEEVMRTRGWKELILSEQVRVDYFLVCFLTHIIRAS